MNFKPFDKIFLVVVGIGVSDKFTILSLALLLRIVLYIVDLFLFLLLLWFLFVLRCLSSLVLLGVAILVCCVFSFVASMSVCVLVLENSESVVECFL